jgi:hypothetical protein
MPELVTGVELFCNHNLRSSSTNQLTTIGWLGTALKRLDFHKLEKQSDQM